MRLTLEVVHDKALDDEILRLVKTCVGNVLDGEKARHIISAAVEKAVDERVGNVLRELVRNRLRHIVEEEMGRRMKGVPIERIIRDIVADLFKQRFGTPKDGTGP